LRHAGARQLIALARHGVQIIAAWIVVRQRRPARDARPARPPRQAEIARRPARGLQVINQIEAAQLPRQPPQSRQIEPGRPAIDQHLVEPRARLRERHERRRRQQADRVAAMMRADIGKRRERQHEIAHRPEPDHQHTHQPSSSR